ncbi:hypothetical protein [Rhizobium sp. 18065]|uniref:hypothetical protein n=1 Tax=Rhizobium sp. 18065 TaxID=2681411 RepID=UPI00135BF1F1|nr:hypothetical protein [Rhizobium sp. 18065]
MMADDEDEDEPGDLALLAPLEVKSVDEPDGGAHQGASRELARLLADFTLEMRAQFDLFRRLRSAADALLDGADEAAAKLARADIKAATDAIALIIRTLEKIDSLQRQLTRDRTEADERQQLSHDPQTLRRKLALMIEARVAERVEVELAARAPPGG